MYSTTEKPSWHTPETEEDKDLARTALWLTKAFDTLRTTYTRPQKELPKTTEFGLMVVHGTTIPLVVVGAAEDFDKGLIKLHPDSDSHNIIVSTDYPTVGFGSGSAVARFGPNPHEFISFYGQTSETVFAVPHYTNTDGTGGMALGYIATFDINTGMPDVKNYWDHITPKLAVAFAGFDAYFRNVKNVYHGLTAIASPPAQTLKSG